MRQFSSVCAFLFALLPAIAAEAQIRSAVPITQVEAQRHGLHRAWFTQASLDRTRDRLVNVTLNGPHIFLQTSQSVLQVLDAETGGRIWTAQVGNRDYFFSPPAANEKFVAVLNGTTLYVLDRATGATLHEHRLRWAPSGSVAIGENWVYVPAFNGQVEVIGIEDPKVKWNCGSTGYIDMPPLVARNSLVWGTSKGHVYFASKDRGEIDFRLHTTGPVAAPMGYWPPLILTASRDGFLHAIHEQTGQSVWKFSLGTAVNDAPIAIRGAAYIISEAGGLYCLACDDGTERWFSPKPMRVLAVTENYVYAVDRFGDTLVLDAKTGGHLDTIATSQLPIKYTNIQNDRLYMATKTGLVLCLHEQALKEPLQHLLPEDPTAEKPADGTEPAPQDQPMSAPAENPFGAPAP